jgi:gamma-glutamylcyclotransferase (GGCT)/AIG2-like uncharacterized protein YtfP
MFGIMLIVMNKRQKKKANRYYIAYGANMNHDLMIGRRPESKFIGKTVLKDTVLTMPFYANIEEKEGAETPVAIWKISANGEKSLDKQEGVEKKQYYKSRIKLDMGKKVVKGLVYIMTDEYKNDKDMRAKDGYEDKIRQGYIDSGFSEKDFQPQYEDQD